MKKETKEVKVLATEKEIFETLRLLVTKMLNQSKDPYITKDWFFIINWKLPINGFLVDNEKLLKENCTFYLINKSWVDNLRQMIKEKKTDLSNFIISAISCNLVKALMIWGIKEIKKVAKKDNIGNFYDFKILGDFLEGEREKYRFDQKKNEKEIKKIITSLNEGGLSDIIKEMEGVTLEEKIFWKDNTKKTPKWKKN